MSRSNPRNPPAYIGKTGCPTGKVGFPNRKEARKAARRIPDRQTQRGHLTAYFCDQEMCGMWHVGHLPWQVEKGNMPRSEIRESQPRKDTP